METELTNEQKAKLLGWKYKFSESRNEFRWYGPDGDNYLSCPIITEEEFREKYPTSGENKIHWPDAALFVLLACVELESKSPY